MAHIKKLDQCGISFLLIVLLLFCFSGTASAADRPKIALSTSAEKEVIIERDGKKVVERIPLDKASRVIR